MSMHGAGEEPASGESPEPFRAGHLLSDTFLQLACDGGNKVPPRRRAALGSQRLAGVTWASDTMKFMQERLANKRDVASGSI